MSKSGKACVAACGIAVSVAGLQPAAAFEGCNGQYSAALLRPLPKPTVIALDLHDNSPVNVSLGQAFMSGIKAAGQKIDGPPSAKISVTYQILGEGNGGGGYSGGGLNSGGPNTGWSKWGNGGAAALQGGQTLALPDFPRYDMFTPQQPAQAATLVLRAEVHDIATGALDWVGSLQCTMRSTDNEQLAYQLGRLIGGSVGQRRDRQRI